MDVADYIEQLFAKLRKLYFTKEIRQREEIIWEIAFIHRCVLRDLERAIERQDFAQVKVLERLATEINNLDEIIYLN